MKPKYFLVLIFILLLFLLGCNLTITSNGKYKSTIKFFDIVNIKK